MATITLRSCSLLLSLSLAPFAHAEEPAKPGAANKPPVAAPAAATPANPASAPTSIAPVTIEPRKAAAGASPVPPAAPDVSAISG
ncbi:MAG TPA: hypothetical protein VFZ61_19020, partial [Polyangiales bacterium]